MSDRPAVRLEDFLATFPDEERRSMEAAYQRGLEDYHDLKELREALDQTQAQVGERLGVGHPAVSKLERRADLYVSTLRQVVEALGGRLDVVVRFPDRPPARLGKFSGEDARPIRRRRGTGESGPPPSPPAPPAPATEGATA